MSATPLDVGLLNFQTATEFIAIYNACELLFIAFTTFKSYKSKYFLFIVLSCLGIFTNAITVYMINAGLCAAPVPLGCIVLSLFGWVAMVSGFSLVMISRLSLICPNATLIKWFKYIIFFNIIATQTATCALAIEYFTTFLPEYYDAYNTIEKIQLVVFVFQEMAIGFTYLWYIRKNAAMWSTDSKKGITIHTIGVTIFVMLLDFSTWAIQLANLYNYQLTFKQAVYSIKLKAEFYVIQLLTENLKSKSGKTGVQSTTRGPAKSVVQDESTKKNPLHE